MTTKHHLFTSAKVWRQGESPSSHSLGHIIGESDDGLILIKLAGNSTRLEMGHRDGRQLRIDLLTLYQQAEQLFAEQPPAPSNASLELTANLIENLDQTARAHEMLGAQHPEDHAAIRNEYTEARAVLWHHIAGLVAQRDQMAALLELGATTMHELVDGALDMAEDLLGHVNGTDPAAIAARDKARERIKALRGMAPTTAADVAPGSEQVQ